MDLNSIITLGIFGTIFGLIIFKGLTRYLKHEKEIVTSDQKANYETAVRSLQEELVSTVNSRNGYKQKLNHLKENYDFEFDESELLDDPAVEEEKIIPMIASAIFPKMPPKLKALLGKDEIENAIVGAAEKNPKLIADWVGKFFSKKDDPQSKTTVLKESYI